MTGVFSAARADDFGTMATNRSRPSGVKTQVMGRRRFKRDPHLDPPFPHHFNYLLVDNIVHGDVDPGVAIAKMP